jgi:hypothetical protein
MATVQFADMQSRPTEFLDFTSLALQEYLPANSRCAPTADVSNG